MDDLDKRFVEDREFFDNHMVALQSAAPLSFGKKPVSTNDRGVRPLLVRYENFSRQPGDPRNVLVEKGFGTIIFGTVVTDSYSRR